ncbi:methyl-accepting chemotaxis protein [Anaerosporobacter sp.]|uniref:methyl-accepting chemotaxis protein n=1 Tax=Anaerosporobacter sp. TaxID=1872529 RepID=UPI00286EDCF3|nr:methyl-accepting chemotaxis protein [Anaerosporobacter sp.]
MKLRKKFILLFACFALIPTLAVGTTTKLIVGKQGIKEAQESAAQELELAQRGTETILDMIGKINTQASSEIVFHMFLEGSTQVRVEEVNNRLKAITDTYAVLDNAILTDTNGVVVGSDDSSMIGFNCNDAWPDVIESVKNTGEQTTSSGTKNVISGEVMLVIATPVKEGNTAIGYLLSAVNVNQIYAKIIEETAVLKTGYIYVVEEDGTLLMHPNSELLLDNETFNTMSIAEEVKSSEHANGKYVYEGVERYYTSDTGSNGWIYIAILPKAEVEELSNFIVKLLLIVVGVIAVIAPWIALLVAHGILKPINKVSERIGTLAKGDFTEVIDVKSKNEIGKMARRLNKTTDSLAEAVQGVKYTADNMSTQSQGLKDMSNEMNHVIDSITSSIETIATGSSMQASAIQSTLDMLIRLEDEISDIDKNMNSVDKSASNARDKARDGQNTVNMLAGAIREIHVTFEQFSKKIIDLDMTVSKIGNITNAINDIASQTNLLALNAAIEAARAGEMGKGFAVVAEEVKVLAEQSQKSAEEIGVLIQNVNQETTSVVKDSSRVDELLAEQSTIVESVLSSFEETLNAIQIAEPAIESTFNSLAVAEKAGHAVREKAESVAAAAHENMASTQLMSATAEELLATSEEVSQNAMNASQSAKALTEMMAKFKC